MVLMDEIIKYNRKTLNKIECFISHSNYENSNDLYGLPRHVYHLINKPINNDITYVDLLTFLSTFLDKKKNQLFRNWGICIKNLLSNGKLF